MSRLELIPVHNRITDPQPAVFLEGAAAAYVGMSRPTFRKSLLFSGLIPYSYHIDGKQRIFFRSDLEAYIQSLERRRMEERKVSQVALKGVT